MKTLDRLLSEYGESHQNPINKAFHWVCIPLIMFSLVGLLTSIPFPFSDVIWLNWGSVVMVLAVLYYLRLSFSMFIGFLLIGFLLVWGNVSLLEQWGSQSLVYISLSIFFVAWVGQFIGHHIEGKKPSFLKDIQFLLIGPAWLLHFIYKKMGIPY